MTAFLSSLTVPHGVSHPNRRRQRGIAIRRPAPIRRVRLEAHRAAAHQARRSSAELVHATVQPLRALEQDINARTQPAPDGAQTTPLPRAATATKELLHAVCATAASAGACSVYTPQPSAQRSIIAAPSHTHAAATASDRIWEFVGPVPQIAS